jgi:hypothetical protein
MKLTEVEKYQYTTIVFGIAVIVMAVLFMRAKAESKIVDTDQSALELKACSADLSGWLAKYPAGTPPTVQSQTDLVQVLTKCSGDDASSTATSLE